MTAPSVRRVLAGDARRARAAIRPRPRSTALPLRSTAFATLYGVRLTSLGPYRLFGYLSVPTGPGPFPAIYYAPKYQSVLEIIPQGTANLQRSRYVTFSLAARGQRNADSPYAAMFPGLLTERHRRRRVVRLPRHRGRQRARPRVPVDVPGGRSLARGRGGQRRRADHGRADGRRDARRDHARALLRDGRARAARPTRIRSKRSTTTCVVSGARRGRAPDPGYYDLRAFAPRVAARTLLHGGRPGLVLDGRALGPLVAALRGPVTVHDSEQSTLQGRPLRRAVDGGAVRHHGRARHPSRALEGLATVSLSSGTRSCAA